MLRVQSIACGKDLGYLIGEKGFVLTPKAGTPLKIMFDCSTKGNQLITAGEGFTEFDQVVALTNSELGEETPHDLAQKQAVTAAYQSCSNAIAFSRNTVNPAIKAIHEAVGNAANELVDPDRMAVAPFYYDELFDLTVWSAMISKHEEIPVASVRIDTGTYPDPDPLYLAEVIKSGSDKIDERISAFISSQSDGYLASVYSAMFNGNLAANGRLQLFSRTQNGELTFAPNRLNVHHCAVAYLLAKGMINKSPEGVRMSQKDYEYQVSTLIAQAGRRLCRAIEMRKEDLRTGFLILDPAVGNRTVIVVNGDVYDKFLRDGGTPEIVIGTVQMDGDNFLPGVVARAEEALRTYRKYEAELIERHDASFVSRIKSALNHQIMELVRNTPDEELSRSRQECVQELREHLRLVGRQELDNLWVLIRRLVCHILYPHSDALKILTSFDEVAGRLPDANSNLVEYHVLLNYVLDYLVDCLEVRDMPC